MLGLFLCIDEAFFNQIEWFEINSHYKWIEKKLLSSRVFAYGPGDWDSILGRVIAKTQKMVLDASLPDTQHYKV